jgi:elongator complex protein 2
MSSAAVEHAGAHGGAGGGGVEVERVFIGAGCNRVVNNVSWGTCGLVAFGAQNAVTLFSPLVRLLLLAFIFLRFKCLGRC